MHGTELSDNGGMIHEKGLVSDFVFAKSTLINVCELSDYCEFRSTGIIDVCRSLYTGEIVAGDAT